MSRDCVWWQACMSLSEEQGWWELSCAAPPELCATLTVRVLMVTSTSVTESQRWPQGIPPSRNPTKEGRRQMQAGPAVAFSEIPLAVPVHP